MTRALTGALTLVVAVSVGFLAFMIVSSAIHVADADQPGKARGRVQPEPRPVLSSQIAPDRFRPGKSWDGVGRGGLDQNAIEGFSGYPLFWLGEVFADFNLQAALHVRYSAPEGAKAGDRVTFIYGECVPVRGSQQCAVPAQVQVQPACAVLPAWIEEGAKAGPLQNLAGGAKLQRFADGHAMVWTGEIVVEITVAANPSLLNRAIAELRGAGRNKHTPGQSLPAADLSGCTS